MRTRLVTTFAALLVASAHLAQAQTPPTKPAPPAVPSIGLLDFGFRGGGVDRRRSPLRALPRPASRAPRRSSRWTKNTEKYRFEASAFNVGYRDQRYSAGYIHRQAHA